jgi:hypothetical protein
MRNRNHLKGASRGLDIILDEEEDFDKDEEIENRTRRI